MPIWIIHVVFKSKKVLKAFIVQFKRKPVGGQHNLGCYVIKQTYNQPHK
jgi:hypothetical protein